MAGNVLAELIVKVKADLSELNSSLKGAETQVSGLASAFSALLPVALVATVVAGFNEMMTSAAKYADSIQEMSDRTGIGTTELQKLDYAARITGTSLGSIETLFNRMRVSLGDAFMGVNSAVKAFNELGLSLYGLKTLNPEQQFYAIAMAISQIPDPMERAAIAQDIFGRGAAQLMPLINNYDELARQAERLGVLSEQQIADSAAAADAAAALGFAWQQVTGAFAATVLPVLTPVIEQLASLVSWVKEALAWWIELNRATGGWTGLLTPGLPMPRPGQVPSFASGGIVTSPTLAMVGESGPEAIVPLSQMGNNITIQAGAFMGNEGDARRFARTILDLIREENRIRTTGRLA